MSGDYYTSPSPAVRWSLLRHLRDGSPAHYRWAVEHPDAGDTASREALRAIHTAVLEPYVWATEYAPYDGTRRGKGWDLWCDTHPGITGLSRTAYDAAESVAAAVRSHRVAGPLITSPAGRSEVRIDWTDPVTGLACRGRVDRLVQVGQRLIVADLKTVASCDVDDVLRLGWRHGWHGQLAHYCAGVRELHPGLDVIAALICVEQSPPHDCSVLYLSPALMAEGESERRLLIDRVAECERANDWPGRYDRPQVVDVPHWVEPEITFDHQETP